MRLWLAGGVPDPLSDALYTAVGFGVLGVQRLQVERRRVQKDLASAASRVLATLCRCGSCAGRATRATQGSRSGR